MKENPEKILELCKKNSKSGENLGNCMRHDVLLKNPENSEKILRKSWYCVKKILKILENPKKSWKNLQFCVKKSWEILEKSSNFV